MIMIINHNNNNNNNDDNNNNNNNNNNINFSEYFSYKLESYMYLLKIKTVLDKIFFKLRNTAICSTCSIFTNCETTYDLNK